MYVRLIYVFVAHVASFSSLPRASNPAGGNRKNRPRRIGDHARHSAERLGSDPWPSSRPETLPAIVRAIIPPAGVGSLTGSDDGPRYDLTGTFVIKFVLADVIIIAALLFAGPIYAVAITALLVVSVFLVWYLVERVGELGPLRASSRHVTRR